ncbi:MAG: aminomethyl transferase family protein [Desulfobacteraceae bacterium]|nr:aminomethyl transferase family protein [Desulfobacteraceae bacterium]
MTINLKTTPLYKWHKAAGANMADFGGFDMPLWYDTGVKNEHLAVLTSAGIFDTSHMACIDINGKDSFTLLNYCFTRDIATLKSGRCIYGAFLNNDGYCIDDAIVYKFSDSDFMICVNAGMGATVTQHLNSNKKDFNVSIKDLSGKIAKMDIQGLNSARILSKLIQNPEIIFNQMPYFSFKGNFTESILGKSEVKLLDGTPILLSRSGYTGEFGFEIFLNPEKIVKFWEDILSIGTQFSITACGLGARDSLRAGACLPLSHQDIGHWKFINHPWDFAMPYTHDKTSFTKTFIGSDALLPDKNDHYIFPFVGDSLRKVSAGANTQVLDKHKNQMGKVLTCATDMGITWHNDRILSVCSKNLPQDLKIKGISCGFVMVSKKLTPGTTLLLKEGKRKINATIVTDIRPDRTARKKINNFI